MFDCGPGLRSERKGRCREMSVPGHIAAQRQHSGKQLANADAHRYEGELPPPESFSDPRPPMPRTDARAVPLPRGGRGLLRGILTVTAVRQMTRPILKRAPIGWNQDDFDVGNINLHACDMRHRRGV
jgi:hypothetical protein